MQITRRAFLGYCSVCGAALAAPGCCRFHHHGPPVTTARGLDPPNVAHPELPAWPVDPEIEARKEQIRLAWQNRPRPVRQDGLWPYLLIRAFAGDQGARPIVRSPFRAPGLSPDIIVVEGFPTPPPALAHPPTIYSSHSPPGSTSTFPLRVCNF